MIGFLDVGYLGFWNPELNNLYAPAPEVSNIQLGTGLGIRWMTSVGPVAIDIGFNPRPVLARGEAYFTPYFSFGNL